MKATLYAGDYTVELDDGKRVGGTRAVGCIAFPRDGAPGYAAIFVEDARHVRLNGRSSIILVWEREAQKLDDGFFEAILRVSQDLICREFYAYSESLDERRGGGFRLFDRFMDARGANIRLIAPQLDDWETGVHIIRSWKPGEVLCGVTKNTILGRQLGAMTRESLSPSQAPAFYAVRALLALVPVVEHARPAGWGAGAWEVAAPPDGGWA